MGLAKPETTSIRPVKRLSALQRIFRNVLADPHAGVSVVVELSGQGVAGAADGRERYLSARSDPSARPRVSLLP
jgi:hypothetical protein